MQLVKNFGPIVSGLQNCSAFYRFRHAWIVNFQHACYPHPIRIIPGSDNHNEAKIILKIQFYASVIWREKKMWFNQTCTRPEVFWYFNLLSFDKYFSINKKREACHTVYTINNAPKDHRSNIKDIGNIKENQCAAF